MIYQLQRFARAEPVGVRGQQGFAQLVRRARSGRSLRRTLLVIAGRKFASAGLDPQAPWDGSPWAGTRIAWPAALKGDARGRDLIGGAPPPPPGDAIDIGQALRTLPVAVWAFGEAGG